MNFLKRTLPQPQGVVGTAQGLPRLLWHEWPVGSDRNCCGLSGSWAVNRECYGLGGSWKVQSIGKERKFHTCGGPRRRPCLGLGRGRRISEDIVRDMHQTSGKLRLQINSSIFNMLQQFIFKEVTFRRLPEGTQKRKTYIKLLLHSVVSGIQLESVEHVECSHLELLQLELTGVLDSLALS